ncbi:MAG: hypothetical protein RLP44_02530 [Aggregatilineales bacterium]
MTALGSVLKAVQIALADDVIAGDRAYPFGAVAGTERPYLVYFPVIVREANELKRDDAEIVMQIECVANRLSDAMDGAGRISALFNNAGEQDGGAIVGDAGWRIRTITQEGDVTRVESFENAREIYHGGFEFRFSMEAKS